jgi:oxygen-dependent protoporphyrinogen oxidase
MTSVAIIGGGVTGLTAAYYLKQLGIPATVYEASAKTGGVIRSIKKQGYLAECGPNSILETSPVVTELIQALNLEEERIYAAPESGKRFLVRDGAVLPVPDSVLNFLKSPLFSTNAKLRLALEPFIRRAPKNLDETVSSFVRRRIGSEFLDRAINPLVAGIYAGDPAKLSVRSAFPRLHQAEQNYGSLILAQMFGARKRQARGEQSKATAPKFSFRNGLQTLTDSLTAELLPNIHFNSPVEKVQKNRNSWEVFNCADRSLPTEHSAVLLTAPAPALARTRVVVNNSERSLAPLAGIRYAPVSSLVLGFSRSQVRHPLDGFGLLVPERENLSILGTIFSSTIFPGRAPEDCILLTTYLGGMRSPDLPSLPRSQQLTLALKDLRHLLGIRGQPTFVHHTTFLSGIAQYEVGFTRVQQFMEEIELRTPGLFLTGHFRNGVSVADCLVAGRRAAQRIAAQVQTDVSPANFNLSPSHA